jgi:hypothetical protein
MVAEWSDVISEETATPDSDTAVVELQPVTVGITTKPLLMAYILAILLVILHGATGFIFYRTAEIVK